VEFLFSQLEFVLLILVLEDVFADFVDFGAQLLVLVENAVVELELLVALAFTLLQLEEFFLVALQVAVVLLLQRE